MTFKRTSPHMALTVEQKNRVAQFVSLLFTIAQRTARTERHAAGTRKKQSQHKNQAASVEQLSQLSEQKTTYDFYDLGPLLLRADFIKHRLFFCAADLS